MSYAARLARYSEASSSLALLSDRKLGRLVDDASTAGSGIGGTSAVVDQDNHVDEDVNNRGSGVRLYPVGSVLDLIRHIITVDGRVLGSAPEMP
jgi:hypothetical protein